MPNRLSLHKNNFSRKYWTTKATSTVSTSSRPVSTARKWWHPIQPQLESHLICSYPRLVYQISVRLCWMMGNFQHKKLQTTLYNNKNKISKSRRKSLSIATLQPLLSTAWFSSRVANPTIKRLKLKRKRSGGQTQLGSIWLMGCFPRCKSSSNNRYW